MRFRRKKEPRKMSTMQKRDGRIGAVAVFCKFSMIVYQLSRVIIWKTAMRAYEKLSKVPMSY
jgi:hypothetical protein